MVMLDYITRITPFLAFFGLILLILYGLDSNVGQHAFTFISFFAHSCACYFSLRTILVMRKARKAISDDAVTKTIDSDLRHCIIIPNYKESVGTLCETLGVLRLHPLAQTSYDIVLAMEAREDKLEREEKFLQLKNIFGDSFASMHACVHPSDIAGEAAGKSSNVNHAARFAANYYNSDENVVLTVMDADTHIMPLHFSSINRLFDITKTHTMFVPPIVFDRNGSETPALVRAADLLWAAAGMSGLSSCIRPPTAVYSLPLAFAKQVGFWDADAVAIGEDLHMYLKCFLYTRGRLNVETIWAPASQNNIHAIGSDVYIARYNQGLRHMWGSLDTGYVLKTLVSGNKSAMMYDDQENRIHTHYWRMLMLLHRLYEAHILPVQMTIFVVTGLIADIYGWNETRLAPVLPVLVWTSILRVVGILQTFMWMHNYEEFHKAALALRKQHSSIGQFSPRNYMNYLDYGLFPVAGMLYGAIAAAQSQISHLFTVNLVYTVSLKPSTGKTLEYFESESDSDSTLI